jgi:hypothetical protein
MASSALRLGKSEQEACTEKEVSSERGCLNAPIGPTVGLLWQTVSADAGMIIAAAARAGGCNRVSQPEQNLKVANRAQGGPV